MRAADHEFGDILTHRMRQKVPCIRISSRESAGEGICRAVGGACPDLGRSAADACGVDVDTLIDVSDLVAPPTSVSTRRGQPRSAHSVGPSDGFQAKGLRRPDRAFWLPVRQTAHDGGLVAASNPATVGRIVLSTCVGLRQTSAVNEPKTPIDDLEAARPSMLSGFAAPNSRSESRTIGRRQSMILKNGKRYRTGLTEVCQDGAPSPIGSH